MKIDKVIVHNFRNFQSEQIFNLNDGITVFFGDNGNGKSSIFDGIEWCLTGKIKRFPKYADLKTALANKEMAEEEVCYVEIYFGSLVLKRSFTLKNDKSYSNQDVQILDSDDMKKIVSGESSVNEYLNNEFFAVKNNEFNLGKMLDETYILSQDQINDFITRDKPDERFKALSSIMGFDRAITLMKNIKTSNEILNLEIKNFDTQLNDSNKKFEKIKNQIHIIDNDLLEDFKDKAKLKIITYSTIENIRMNLLNDIKVIDEVLNLKNRLDEDQKNSSFRDLRYEYSSTAKKLNNDSISLNYEIKDIEEILLKHRKQLKIIKADEIKQNEIENLRKKIIKLKKNEDAIFSQSDLKNKIKDINKHFNKIDYAIKYKTELIELETEIKNIETEIHERSKSIILQENMLKITSDREKEINDEMIKGGENSATQILTEALDSVIKFIELERVDQNVCPACSTYVGEELASKVRKNKSKWVGEIEESVEREKHLIETRTQIKTEINELNKSVRNLKKINENQNDEKNKIETKIMDITNNINYDSQITGNKLKMLREAFLTYQNNLIDLENRLKNLKEIEKLETKISEYVIDEDITEEISVKKFEIKVNKLEKDRDKLLKNLEEINIKIDENVKNIKDVEKINDEIKKYRHSLMDYSIENLTNELAKDKENSEYLLLKIDPVIKQLELLEENKHLDKQLKALTKELSQIIKKKEELTVGQEEINIVYNQLSKKYGNKAIEFLNNSNNKIKRYYNFLNPNPSEYRDILFDVEDKDKLFIKVKQNREDNIFTEVSTVLSSGQLNVLAIAIFLATNESQTFSYFDFVAIDDPVQNMDDVNRFSVCDVLSNMNKQTIFSTHDQEFLSLFLKKNEGDLDKINLYHLDSFENSYEEVILE